MFLHGRQNLVKKDMKYIHRKSYCELGPWASVLSCYENKLENGEDFRLIKIFFFKILIALNQIESCKTESFFFLDCVKSKPCKRRPCKNRILSKKF